MTAFLNELYAWLDHYLNFEKNPQKNILWLDTMRFLCSRLHNPEQSCPSFHIAGSKGKGSVSCMISNILAAAGYQVGLYTSPHILDFTERVSTPAGPFDDSVYEKSAKTLMETVSMVTESELPQGRRPTWFELVTLFGMLCFKNAQCDWAVYEVGLGGRLDSTNVIFPQCTCITPIELEHTEYLGTTIEEIAKEKAGIIKNGVPVVISAQNPQAKKVFLQSAQEKNAPIICTDECSTISHLVYKSEQSGRVTLSFSIQSPLFARPLTPSLTLLGDFQAQNAATAALAVKTVFPALSEDSIEKGLSNTFLPGRFEMLPKRAGTSPLPEMVLDGAHTVNSIHFTVQTFWRLYPHGTRAHLLYASAADKDIEHIVETFKDGFSFATITRPGISKKTNIPCIEEAFSASNIAYTTQEDFALAIPCALKKALQEDAVLLVIGSFYLVAEVKRIISC